MTVKNQNYGLSFTQCMRNRSIEELNQNLAGLMSQRHRGLYHLMFRIENE